MIIRGNGPKLRRESLAIPAKTHRYYGSMGDIVALRQRPRLPDTLSREGAEKYVRDVLEDSAHIVWSNHAYVRMRERDISDSQVLQVLKRGLVIANPQWSEERNWKFTMEADTAGEIVRVVLALDVDKMGLLILVITVIA